MRTRLALAQEGASLLNGLPLEGAAAQRIEDSVFGNHHACARLPGRGACAGHLGGQDMRRAVALTMVEGGMPGHGRFMGHKALFRMACAASMTRSGVAGVSRRGELR